MNEFRLLAAFFAFLATSTGLAWLGDALFDHSPGSATITSSYVTLAFALVLWLAYLVLLAETDRWE